MQRKSAGVAATNYKSVYTKDDGTCSFPGCTGSTAANYKALYTLDDGSCKIRRRALGQEGRQQHGRLLATGCPGWLG